MAALWLDTPPGTDRKSHANCATGELHLTAPPKLPSSSFGRARCPEPRKQRTKLGGRRKLRSGALGAFFISAVHQPKLDPCWAFIHSCHPQTQNCLLPGAVNLNLPFLGRENPNDPFSANFNLLVSFPDATWDRKFKFWGLANYLFPETHLPFNRKRLLNGRKFNSARATEKIKQGDIFSSVRAPQNTRAACSRSEVYCTMASLRAG